VDGVKIFQMGLTESFGGGSDQVEEKLDGAQPHTLRLRGCRMIPSRVSLIMLLQK